MTSILSDNQRSILALIAAEKSISDRFYLTGGTALSEFYLQHRLSEDLDFFSEDEFEFSYGPPGELAKQLHFTDEHMEAILAILGTKKLKVASKLSAIKMLIAYFLSDDPQPVEVLTNFVLLLHEKELKPKKDR